MDETTPSPPEPKADPFALAIPVSERVQIQNIFLAGCAAKRAPHVDLEQEGVGLSYDIPNVEVSTNRELGRIFVRPFFTLATSREGEPDAEPMLAIEASFVLIYSVQSFDGLEDQNISAFARTNGIYNAWPYWREFVQNTIARMALPSTTIPVFRFPS